jgi:5-dehydro-2-deoxygluconokinase
MSIGDHKSLYLLPFDHRHSCATGMFDFQPPPTAYRHAAVTDNKQLVSEGLQQTLGNGVPRTFAGIRVDEDFGAGRSLAMQAPGSDDEVP